MQETQQKASFGLGTIEDETDSLCAYYWNDNPDIWNAQE